ncbi:hypothetical protein X777_09720 [Ooceraea biroi]|uniref:Uncharacterized protein n=1 Tax=Ooceraea biroi TaxID=2015173 RepID=A0A026W754_OOCBI|nr:hypothetical protein X777_09720 [Ooceraea biroi]
MVQNMMVLRVHGDDLMFGGGGSGVITHSPRIPQMEMMKVHIPFTFKLHESFKSTYADKITQSLPERIMNIELNNERESWIY